MRIRSRENRYLSLDTCRDHWLDTAHSDATISSILPTDVKQSTSTEAPLLFTAFLCVTIEALTASGSCLFSFRKLAHMSINCITVQDTE